MGNALKNEIQNLNQSEVEISEMMQTRQDDLDRIQAYKEELKHTIDEMQKDTREIREALEGSHTPRGALFRRQRVKTSALWTSSCFSAENDANATGGELQQED